MIGTLIICLIAVVATLGMFCIIMSIIYDNDNYDYIKLHNSIVNNTIKYDNYEVNAYTAIIEEPVD